MRLFREVRCLLSQPPQATSRDAPAGIENSWSGTGGGGKVAAFWFLRAVVEGPVDARTGYLCDIKELDELLRGPVLARLTTAKAGGTSNLADLAGQLRAAFLDGWSNSAGSVRLVRLELGLSPFTTVSVSEEDSGMVRVTQSFEFAAAHRLSCPGLSDEENRRLFGKCSNPHGHGHNYVLEVTVIGEPGSQAGATGYGATNLPQLDRVVRERVIEPLDHKNLNAECPDFRSLNPTVENIARAIWRRLDGRFDHCRLFSVKVWETPKTCAEYNGD